MQTHLSLSLHAPPPRSPPISTLCMQPQPTWNVQLRSLLRRAATGHHPLHILAQPYWLTLVAPHPESIVQGETQCHANWCFQIGQCDSCNVLSTARCGAVNCPVWCCQVHGVVPLKNPLIPSNFQISRMWPSTVFAPAAPTCIRLFNTFSG